LWFLQKSLAKGSGDVKIIKNQAARRFFYACKKFAADLFLCYNNSKGFISFRRFFVFGGKMKLPSQADGKPSFLCEKKWPKNPVEKFSAKQI
jgi:hypothetical protein